MQTSRSTDAPDAPAWAPPRSLVSRLPVDPLTAAAAAVIAASVLFWLWLGRGTYFRGDDFDFIYSRDVTSWDALLQPHVQHLSLVGSVYFRALWATVGFLHFWPYRALTVLAFAVILAELFLLVRRANGAPLALCLTTPMAFLGAAHEDILWVFQSQFLIAIAAGMGCLLLLPRRGLVPAALAGLLLMVSLATASHGIFFVIVVVLRLVIARDWRRLAIPLVPAVVYECWRLAYDPGGASGSGLRAVTEFTVSSYVHAITDFGGLPNWWGRVLVVASVVALVVALGRGWRPTPVQISMVALPIVAFVVTGIARADGGLQPRYALPDTLYVLLAVGHVLPRWSPTRTGAVAAGVVVVGAVAVNVQTARDNAATQRVTADTVRLAFGVVDLAGRSTRSDLQLAPLETFAHFTPARFFAAQARRGPFVALDEAGIERSPEAARQSADDISARALGLSIVPTASRAAAGATCRALPDADGTPKLDEVIVPVGGLTVVPERGDDVVYWTRRWAQTYPAGARAASAGPVSVRVVGDRGTTPWKLQLQHTRSVRACR